MGNFKIGLILIGIILIIVAIQGYVMRGNQKKRLRKNSKVTQGAVVELFPTGRFGDGLHLKYAFTSNGKKYISDKYSPFENSSAFIGKYFIVVYDSLDPSLSDVLFTTVDYANYNFQFPDSLSWTKAYLKK